VTPKWPTSPEYYNSAITVNAEGETIANYRKSFLHYTDETWALEGPDGFYDDEIEGLGTVAMGICEYLDRPIPHTSDADFGVPRHGSQVSAVLCPKIFHVNMF